jgi:hypothetical protein
MRKIAAIILAIVSTAFVTQAGAQSQSTTPATNPRDDAAANPANVYYSISSQKNWNHSWSVEKYADTGYYFNAKLGWLSFNILDEHADGTSKNSEWAWQYDYSDGALSLISPIQSPS